MQSFLKRPYSILFVLLLLFSIIGVPLSAGRAAQGWPTLPPTWTPAPTSTDFPTWTPYPTHTETPTQTQMPSQTPTASETPTETPTATPTLPPSATVTLTPSPVVSPTQTRVLPAGAPTPVARIPSGDNDIFNILLVGSDKRPTDNTYRTDTLMIVSINRTTETVALLSIPRDLWVYIPTHGYDRINTVSEYGDFGRWPGGGIDLLMNTITAYTGVTIQRYARVNFSSFKQIVDTLGGIDVANDCPLSDYRLIPGKKEGVEANYRWQTLPVGMNHFDGLNALWYARSRETTSDFDRARRQQLVLRAIWRKANEGGLIAKLPTLWPDLVKIVDTNLNLGDLLSLLPMAAQIDGSRLVSYVLGPAQVSDWTTPEGAQVLLPQAAAIRQLMLRFYTPPTSNSVFTEKPIIEVYNASDHADWDQVASSRLAWEGFTPILRGKWDGDALKRTTLYDYTGKAKPGSLAALRQIFALRATQIISQPDPNADADFRLVIKNDYTSCTYR